MEKSIREEEEDETGTLNEPTEIKRGKNICHLKGLVSRAEGLGKIVANILSPYALIYSVYSFLHFFILTPLILPSGSATVPCFAFSPIHSATETDL
jgi:hypothetical protein